MSGEISNPTYEEMDKSKQSLVYYDVLKPLPEPAGKPKPAIPLYAVVNKSEKRKRVVSEHIGSDSTTTSSIYQTIENSQFADNQSPSDNQHRLFIPAGTDSGYSKLSRQKIENPQQCQKPMDRLRHYAPLDFKHTKSGRLTKKSTFSVAVTASAVLVLMVAIAIAFVYISKIRSELASLQRTVSSMESFTCNLQQNITSLSDNFDTSTTKSTLRNKETLEKLDSLLGNNSEAISDLSDAINELMRPKQISSCADIPKYFPSGYYTVMSSNGSAMRVYCDMTRSCGGITGGWMRVAKLDMEENGTKCPRGLVQMRYSNITMCALHSPNAACSPDIDHFTHIIPYTHVCGMIQGHQVGSVDGFQDLNRESAVSIDTNYVDGVSLTHGANHSQHIWTLAAGACPCSNNKPEFVGDDYFCDGVPYTEYTDFCGVVLWDGIGCDEERNTPWFYKELPQPTTDDIQMRVCRDQSKIDEDILIEIIELYVQ